MCTIFILSHNIEVRHPFAYRGCATISVQKEKRISSDLNGTSGNIRLHKLFFYLVFNVPRKNHTISWNWGLVVVRSVCVLRIMWSKVHLTSCSVTKLEWNYLSHAESKDFCSFSKCKSREITVKDYVIDLISLMV